MTAAEKVVQVVMAHLKIVLVSTVNSCIFFLGLGSLVTRSIARNLVKSLRKVSISYSFLPKDLTHLLA